MLPEKFSAKLVVFFYSVWASILNRGNDAVLHFTHNSFIVFFSLPFLFAYYYSEKGSSNKLIFMNNTAIEVKGTYCRKS